MENWDLQRRTDKAREVIDDLVAEIETLEDSNNKLNKEVENLNETIEELREEIDDLKHQDFRDSQEN